MLHLFVVKTDKDEAGDGEEGHDADEDAADEPIISGRARVLLPLEEGGRRTWL